MLCVSVRIAGAQKPTVANPLTYGIGTGIEPGAKSPALSPTTKAIEPLQRPSMNRVSTSIRMADTGLGCQTWQNAGNPRDQPTCRPAEWSVDSSKIRCALSHGHPVREVCPAKRAKQKGSEVNAEVLPQISHGFQIRRAESRCDAGRRCKCKQTHTA